MRDGSTLVSSALMALGLFVCAPTACGGMVVSGNVYQGLQCSSRWQRAAAEWRSVAGSHERAGEYDVADDIRGAVDAVRIDDFDRTWRGLHDLYWSDPRIVQVVATDAMNATYDARSACVTANAGTAGWVFAGFATTALVSLFIAIDGMRIRFPAWGWMVVISLACWPLGLGFYLSARARVLRAREAASG